MEVTARFLKASDVDEVNADGGILMRDVFVGTAISEVADVEVALMIIQLRPARRKADDTDDRDLLLPEALGLVFLDAVLICIDRLIRASDDDVWAELFKMLFMEVLFFSIS